MPIEVFDEYKLRELSDEERFTICEETLKNEKDESKRWDAVWLIGELAENKDENDPMFNKVSDVIEWVLKNDNNGVVKHEACYQIAARNMRNKIPDLVQTAFNDNSVIAKHEAIESLGLMRAFDSKNMIANSLTDPNPDVRETASFVIKRLERLQKIKENYVPSKII